MWAWFKWIISVVNISNLSEPQTSILNNDSNNKADRINGYLNNSEIPLNIPLTINSLTTSNNNIPLTNDNIRQRTVTKYMTLPISENSVTASTNGPNNKADLVSDF